MITRYYRRMHQPSCRYNPVADIIGLSSFD